MLENKKIQSREFRFNWYEKNIVRFLNKYNLPISYQGEFYQFVLSYKEQFLLDFKNLLIGGEILGYSLDFYRDIELLHPFIENQFDDIISIIRCWEAGELGKAESKMNELLSNATQDLCLTTVDRGLFRVRIPSDNDDFSKDPLSLFHIPYHSRHLARNDRYNMAGRPCLYLSSRLNLAWKECGMPQKFYYATFENKMANNDDWKYLYFCSPRDVKNLLVGSMSDEIRQFIIKYLKSYPLIFICSIVNMHHDNPYKPEYIFPQLLMQWIERNFDKIKGIVYFPCVDHDDIRFWKGYNVVLPAKNIDDDGYSLDLKNAFTITTPIYQDNKLSDKSITAILALQKKLSNFMLPQNELGDCLYNMDLIISRTVKLTKRIMTVDSLISLSYIEMLTNEMMEFREKFPLVKVLQSCKESEVYQDRYEKSYIEFSGLYQDFMNVIEIIDHYFAYLSRGFIYEKP